jgi:hypothetical protein
LNEPERWSRFKYKGRDEPKGSTGALERAKLELGPLTSEHQPQLLHHCPCEKCVEENIIAIASEFNARGLVIKGAPRKKTVVENIQRARDAARDFAQTLIALDDHSRNYLLIPSKYLGGGDPIGAAYEKGQGMYLPRPETEEEPACDGVLVEQLRALVEYLDWALWPLTGSEEDGPVDKGGNTNLMMERFGAPAWFLVRQCWLFFENCRPGEATSTDNSPFVAFVNCVHEYATGQIEENSTLLNWIKKLARRSRHHDDLLKRLGPLEAELDELKLDPPTTQGDARIAELETPLPCAMKWWRLCWRAGIATSDRSPRAKYHCNFHRVRSLTWAEPLCTAAECSSWSIHAGWSVNGGGTYGLPTVGCSQGEPGLKREGGCRRDG